MSYGTDFWESAAHGTGRCDGWDLLSYFFVNLQPVGPEDLAPLFPIDLIMQEVSQAMEHIL